MSIANRLKKLEGNKPKEVITYTVLDSKVINGEIVKFEVAKEHRGSIQIMNKVQFDKDYGKAAKDSNIETKLILENLSTKQLKELAL